MKTINPWLQAKLEDPCGTFAHCMLLTRKDGVKLGLTDHQYSFVIAGVTYTPQQATDPSQMESNSRASVDNMEISGTLDEAGLGRSDILTGKYNDARLDIFLVDYTNLPAIAAPGDCVWLKTFLLGTATIEDERFKIECRSLSDYLSKVIVEVTSPTCRAQFGDSRCKKSLTSLQYTATITGITDQRSISVSGSYANGIFTYGKCEFLTGGSTGYIADISNNIGSAITFYSKSPLPFSIGDSVKLTAGCNKTIDQCIAYGNAINFRGEPYLPGIDKWKAGFQEVK